MTQVQKEPAHLAYVDVGTFLGHRQSERPQTALPISASSGTVNNRYMPQKSEASLAPAGTQKTLAQNRRSLEGCSPTLGAMYLSQDPSNSSNNNFIKTIDDQAIDSKRDEIKASEIPSFVKDLRSKYGISTYQPHARPKHIRKVPETIEQHIKQITSKNYAVKLPKENEELLRRVIVKKSQISTPKEAAILETNEYEDEIPRPQPDSKEQRVPQRGLTKKIKAMYPEASQKLKNFS